MSIENVRKGMKAKGSNYKGCTGNPNMGGEQANSPKIDNYDEEKGFIDNSNHATYRMKKGK